MTEIGDNVQGAEATAAVDAYYARRRSVGFRSFLLLVPVAAGKAVAARRPDWRFVVHPDLGHVPQIEDPAWTAEQILEWASVR